MSPLKLNGSTSGFVALDAPAAAGSNTLVLPTGNGSNGQVLTTNGSGTLSWSTVAASQWTTTGSDIYYTTGKVLVGATTSTTTSGAAAKVQIAGTNGGGDIHLALLQFSGSGDGGELTLGSSRGTSVGSYTIVQNGDTLGNIRFVGAAGGSNMSPRGAMISAHVDGAPNATTDVPGRLTFWTTQVGQSNPTERMRITSGGDVGVYHTGGGIQSASSTGAGTTDSLFVGRYSATTPLNGTTSINIRSNGNVYNTNGTYTTLSDERLKENIVDAKSQWTDIKSLRVCNFNFRANTGHETHKQLGLIAQEAEQICPGLVQELTLPGDETTVDAEGNELRAIKTVNMSVLYMKAVKALQEAMERIETLEANNAALEARLSALEVTP